MTCLICTHPDILKDPEGARYVVQNFPPKDNGEGTCKTHAEAVEGLPEKYVLKTGPPPKRDHREAAAGREPGEDG